jgi:hypothetical protein
MRSEIYCVVSGSFTKAKSEIDRAIECFEDYGIKVLSPDKGGLFYPEPGLRWSGGAYPLFSERNISEVLAKQRHIQAIAKSNFLYICALEGYVGTHVAMEMGFAAKRPVYSSHPIDAKLFDDTPWGPGMLDFIDVNSPEEVAQIWQKKQQIQSKLWLP